ncbi:MAG: dihydropteroate synthase [Myxococcota bacterium]|nr:dihydropteroate synthase [Myxococcota bacterium]
MGILNITPDSFSDGGRCLDPRAAVARGLEMIEQGAVILDVGGESTRPFSHPVPVEEECRRVVPVIEKLRALTDVQISVDTTKPQVARLAVGAGASMINDISMLRHGPQLAEIAALSGAELVLMHSRKRPVDMQEDPSYADVVAEVRDELRIAVETAKRSGVDASKIWLDPGIGFAKTAWHNAELLARVEDLVAEGYKVLIGPSRKAFIGAFSGASVDERLAGTAAAVTAAVLGGVHAIRAHDVAAMRQVALVATAIRQRSKGKGA